MVVLIPIKINHEKPITKVKINKSKITRIVNKTRTMVGSGHYNRLELTWAARASKVQIIMRLELLSSARASKVKIMMRLKLSWAARARVSFFKIMWLESYGLTLESWKWLEAQKNEPQITFNTNCYGKMYTLPVTSYVRRGRLTLHFRMS